MGAARGVLDRLTSAGLEFRAEGEALRWKGPAGIVTEHDVAMMKAHKAAFLEALAEMATDTHQAAPAMPPLESLEADPHFLRARARIHPTVRRGMEPEELTRLAYHLARLDMGLPPLPHENAGRVPGETVHPDGRRTFDAGAAYLDAHKPCGKVMLATEVNEHQTTGAHHDKENRNGGTE